jgi:CubicO group peptidase (beta-lactamase class C family)
MNSFVRGGSRAGAAAMAMMMAACAVEGDAGPVTDEDRASAEAAAASQAVAGPAAGAAPAIADGESSDILSPELGEGWMRAARADDEPGPADKAIVLQPTFKYSAILKSGSGTYKTAVNLDWDDFTAQWTTLSGQGYRLIDIDTATSLGQRRYTGVFQPGSGGHAMIAGVPWATFVDTWENAAEDGLRLVDFETYLEGTTRVYAGVWRPGSDGHYLWVGVDWTSFVAKWDELADAGLRLVDIEVYQDGSQLRYAGVWRAGTDGHALWVGVDWNSFAKKWMEFSASGLRLVDLEAYTVNGARLYAGVYRAGSGAYDLIGATSKAALQDRIAALAAEGKRPIAIEIESGQDMPPPGLAAAFHDVIDGHAVGYSFAVAQGGDISAAGGFGYARAPWEATDPSVAMTGTKRSHIASVSKPVTAIAVMNLLEANPQYSLSTPFMNIIGGQFGSVAAGVNAVTLRDLLQHKSGMAEWGYCGPNLQDSMEDLVATPMPGTRGVTSLYSNGNYCLLRLVVEELSNQSYVTYVQNSVLAPMGITGMSCTPDTSKPTLYYRRNQASGAGYLWTDNYAGHCGAYGWYASATDLAKLLLGLRQNTVLTAASMTAMTSQSLGLWSASTVLGNGFHHNGAWLTGDGRGYNGAIIRLPDNTEAVVLINANGYLNDQDYFTTVGTLVDGFNRMQQY